MTGKSYIITRDYGFAPNPFWNICTLATCKPKIRSSAQLKDWIIATTPASQGAGKIVCLMQVSETMTFNQYWENFRLKRPILNGSRVQQYGDNIYHTQGKNFIQENSHHSNDDGSPNIINLKRDTRVDRVLLSSKFYYFGKTPFEVPEAVVPHKDWVHPRSGHRNVSTKDITTLVEYVSSHTQSEGLINYPRQFDKFERYDGK